jgi:hypothetical protein
MPSTLAWLDHDPEERDRMHRILAQFKESDTRDELGLGSLRDALSDLLFPGTSTIQTRLRYMLFVAWMYRDCETRAVPSRQVAGVCRSVELGLTNSLLAQDPEAAGVFGKRARGGLARLPSSVYWAGLGSWGIRRTPLYQDQYHHALDTIYVRRRALRKLDDGEALADPQTATWHPKLPKTPDGFPQRADFSLTRDEACFVRDCIVGHRTHQNSLLAWLALHGQPASVDYVWHHPQLANFPAENQTVVHHARRLSQVMNGAAVLYNLMLAELVENPSLVNEYSALWADWVAADIAGLDDWNLGELWQFAAKAGYSPTPATFRFVRSWLDLRRQGLHWGDVELQGRQLVRDREVLLKRTRSRFDNRQMLLNWGGKSGIDPLSFRWPRAKTMLDDLHAGLKRPEN